MSKAFIASVPLGLILLAALIVPTLIPSASLDFEGWPASRGDRVAEPQVRIANAKHDAAVASSVRGAPAGKRGVGAAPAGKVTPRHGPAAAPRTVPGHTPRRPGSHGGRDATPGPAPAPLAPGSPGSQPSQPSQPSHPEPVQAPDPPPEAVATEEPPVTRDDPAANLPLPPPPSPVEETPAPDEGAHHHRGVVGLVLDLLPR